MLSKSKTFTKKAHTTYRPSTHPNWSRWARNHKYENPNPVLKMQISIEVFPAPTYAELCAMQGAMQAELRTGPINEDKLAFMDAINREFNRCTPKPAWMRRPNESSEPLPPTQHARIDGAQVNELKGILKPETLRRTFISVPVLMAQIQVDIQAKVDIQAAIQAAIQAEIRAKAAAKAAKAAKAAQEAQEAPKTQAEMDAEAEAELLQARRL